MSSFPPPMNIPAPRPGRTALTWGIVLLAVAAALLAVSVIGIVGFARSMMGIEQLVVPGTHEIVLEDAGSYMIYHEHITMVGGRTIRQESPPRDLEVSLTDPQGQDVVLRSPAGSETYSLGGREGLSLFGFEAEQAGTYTLHGEASETMVLTVQRSMLRQVGGMFAFMCGGFLALPAGVAGLVLLIVGLVQRSSRTAVQQ